MPLFIYNGPAGRLTIKGRPLPNGRPVELEGAAAEAAAAHPSVSEVKAGGKQRSARRAGGSVPAAFAKRQALVARAKELGIPAKGKTAELEAAIAAAEAEQG